MGKGESRGRPRPTLAGLGRGDAGHGRADPLLRRRGTNDRAGEGGGVGVPTFRQFEN